MSVVLGQQVGQVQQLTTRRPQADDVGVVAPHVRRLVGGDHRLRLGDPLGVRDDLILDLDVRVLLFPLGQDVVVRLLLVLPARDVAHEQQGNLLRSQPGARWCRGLGRRRHGGCRRWFRCRGCCGRCWRGCSCSVLHRLPGGRSRRHRPYPPSASRAVKKSSADLCLDSCVHPSPPFAQSRNKTRRSLLRDPELGCQVGHQRPTMRRLVGVVDALGLTLRGGGDPDDYLR